MARAAQVVGEAVCVGRVIPTDTEQRSALLGFYVKK